MIGIYCIENTVNNKKYIGQSKDIKERWKYHRWALNHGRHINRHLQASWNKYGQEAFIFSVLEECDEDKLQEREEYYISYYDSNNNGYNLTTGGEGTTGHTLSEEAKLKIGAFHKGKIISEKQRQQASIRHSGENNHWYGKHLPLEIRQKISQTRINNGLSKYGNNNHAKPVICDGIEYDCAKRCADFYHINHATFRSWLRGNRPMPQRFIDMGLGFI